MVFVEGCGDEDGSIHTQRILLQANDTRYICDTRLKAEHVQACLKWSMSFDHQHQCRHLLLLVPVPLEPGLTWWSDGTYLSDFKLLFVLSAWARAFAPSIPTEFPRRLKQWTMGRRCVGMKAVNERVKSTMEDRWKTDRWKTENYYFINK